MNLIFEVQEAERTLKSGQEKFMLQEIAITEISTFMNVKDIMETRRKEYFNSLMTNGGTIEEPPKNILPSISTPNNPVPIISSKHEDTDPNTVPEEEEEKPKYKNLFSYFPELSNSREKE